MRIPYTNIELGRIETDNKPETDSGSTVRTQGEVTYNSYAKIYRESGFAQNIVNVVADDATREGFSLSFPELDQETSEQLNSLIAHRLNELHYKNKLREAIKYSRIYEEGSGLFYSVMSNSDVLQENEKTHAVDLSNIKHVEFVNYFESPDVFTITIDNSSDITLHDYLKPTIQTSAGVIDHSRVSLLVNEFDSTYTKGISIIKRCLDALTAQESGISGARNILERIGAIIFKSPSITLSKSTMLTIKELLSHIKDNVKSTGVMGITPLDSVDILGFSFTGIKDVYDFIIDNLSGCSGIPRSLIIGGQKSGILTGDGMSVELMNYYVSVEQYQENKLKMHDMKLINYLLMEKSNDDMQTITDGALPKYEINYNPLWSLTEKEQVEVAKIRAEGDSIDLTTGKSSPDELRSLDPKYSGLNTDIRPLANEED